MTRDESGQLAVKGQRRAQTQKCPKEKLPEAKTEARVRKNRYFELGSLAGRVISSTRSS